MRVLATRHGGQERQPPVASTCCCAGHGIEAEPVTAWLGLAEVLRGMLGGPIDA